MVSSKDNRIISLWLERQPSTHTRGCYQRDAAKLLDHVDKSLSRITLGDLQGFAQSLIGSGLAPISRVRTLAAVKSLFGFATAAYLAIDPAAELALPAYENRLAERILAEEDVQRILAAKLSHATESWSGALRCRPAGVRSMRSPLA